MSQRGSLNITIQADGEALSIPKKFQLFDSKLKSVRTLWSTTDTILLRDLKPGTYVARLAMTSGIEKEEIVEIEADKQTSIVISLYGISPRETQEWAYFSKSMAVTSKLNDLIAGTPISQKLFNVTGKLHRLVNNVWTSSLIGAISNLVINREGETIRLSTNYELNILELTGDNLPSIFICLPSHPDVRCLIKPAIGPAETVYPLDITISTSNWDSETLLRLLTSGAMDDAKSFINANTAEQLLYAKKRDPAAAAVGGYFLLKTGEIGRMYNWANNLANWFEWMPDGAVIHAWQLLQDNENINQNIRTIRGRLIYAVRRGIPIYTEGLRLLYQGLKMLSYHYGGRDKAVQKAFDIISKYVETVDWSQETTTIVTQELQSHNIEGFPLKSDGANIKNLPAHDRAAG